MRSILILIDFINKKCYDEKKRENDLMKVLLPELKRIFQKAPIEIVVILAMDIAEIVLLTLIPFIIGLCIDGFFDQSYFWFYVLIILQILLIIIRFSNKVLDTRVYERIIESESNSYYENAIQTNSDVSQISSRLNLVDEIPNFFEVELVQIIDVFGEIAFSLMYIFITSGLLLFLVSIAVSILVYIFTKKFHKEIADNNVKLQDHDETREEVIWRRNKQCFKHFTRSILKLRILNSDLEAKSYLMTDILQAGLLIFTMGFTIHMGNYTSGQLFTIITYVIILNERVCEINEVRVRLYNLVDSVSRLGRNKK